MGMGWHLILRECDFFYSTRTSKIVGKCLGVDWDSTFQVRKAKGAILTPLAIAAIGSAENGKEGVISLDWKKLTIAKSPSWWSKITREHDDLADELVTIA